MIKVYLTSEPLNEKFTHYPEVQHKDADAFFVDDKGRLLVKTGGRIIAQYNDYCWTRVEIVDSK